MATRLDRATFQSSLASIGKVHLFWKRGSLRESTWNIDILHIENIIYTIYIHISVSISIFIPISIAISISISISYIYIYVSIFVYIV